jgi:hypothetical protein
LEKRFKGSLPLEEFDWQVGVIVDRSGSGKTSIAKQLFPESNIRGFEYSHKYVLDDFPEELETSEITRILCNVGFASPPDWLKNYDCLSQGDKMRVDIARALCLDKPVIVFDEFTSVVDREIAKGSSFAIRDRQVLNSLPSILTQLGLDNRTIFRLSGRKPTSNSTFPSSG